MNLFKHHQPSLMINKNTLVSYANNYFLGFTRISGVQQQHIVQPLEIQGGSRWLRLSSPSCASERVKGHGISKSQLVAKLLQRFSEALEPTQIKLVLGYRK